MDSAKYRTAELFDEISKGFRIKQAEMDMPNPKIDSWKYTEVSKLGIDKFSEGSQKIILPKAPDNVICCSLEEAAKKHKELFRKFMPMKLQGARDKIDAMHGANIREGIFIYVPRRIGVKSILNAKMIAGHGSVCSHTIIILEEGASLDYVENHVSEDTPSLRNDSVEIYAGPGSRLRFYNLQDWKDVIGISSWTADIRKDAQADFFFAQAGGRFSRVRIDSYLEGPGSRSEQYGMFFGKDSQGFDITTNIYHRTDNTTGDILVKGVLDDESRSVYRGRIKITKEGQQTNSYLSDHTLLLSDRAVSNSIPSLEIDANDVKASHGATLGKLDEEEVFYLMSRGLSRKEAEKLQIKGFFSQVIDKIEDTRMKDIVSDMIEKKVE